MDVYSCTWNRAFIRVSIKLAKNECVNISIYQMKDHFAWKKFVRVKKWTQHTHTQSSFFCELEKSDDDDGSGGAKDPTKKNFVNLFKFPRIPLDGRKFPFLFGRNLLFA